MLGDTLKLLREEKNITQSAMAKLLNISPSTIGMWEQNRRSPDADSLKKLSDFFNVSIDYLLGKTKIKKFNSEKLINTKNELSEKEILDIEKEAEKMIQDIDKIPTVEFCGTPADDEDKEYLKLAYEKFLSDVRVYNKMKYTPKKYKK